MKRFSPVFFSLVLLAANSIAQEAGKVFNSQPPATKYISIEEKQRNSPLWSPPVKNSGSFRQAAAEVLPAVVHVLAAYMPDITKPGEPLTVIYDDALWTNPGVGVSGLILGSASGVVVTDDGLILTAYHCVKGALRLEVALRDRQVFKASVVATDSASDIALLRIDAKNLAFVKIGSIDSVQVGDWVMSVGYPLNLASSVTAGVVSAKDRYLGGVFVGKGIATFIQTDAVMNEGSSGGALVDMSGQLVGINSGIITTTSLYAGYCFAVPVNVISRIANDLLQFGIVRRVGIGARLKNVPDGKGVRLDTPEPQSPALKAGLAAGDVLTAIDGHEITSAGALEDLLLLYQPDQVAEIMFVRKTEIRSVKVKLAAVATSSPSL